MMLPDLLQIPVRTAPSPFIFIQEKSMLNISEKFTAAGKHSLQAQMALLHQLGDKVFESSQKLLALNLQISKTLLADGKESASQLLQAKHPLDFWTHQSSHLKPTMDHILN
jgi:hypothetical protein